MLYAYVYKESKPKSSIVRGLSLVLFTSGVFLLWQVVFPITKFQLYYLFVGPNLISPIADDFTHTVLAASTTKDYTDALNWFEGSEVLESATRLSYTLSVPALGIKQALVDVGGTDLKKSLIGWPTSVAPGRPGSMIVFGHSALRTFYDPTNYTTIFSYLSDIKQGEKVFIDSDGARYTYIVVSKRVVKPDDLSVLEQRFDSSKLVLVTCVPEGTYLYRAVITARLVRT